jgi:hypothetical protein
MMEFADFNLKPTGPNFNDRDRISPAPHFIRADGRVRRRLVPQQGRVQITRVDLQRLSATGIARILVQVDQGQRPPVDWKRNAIQQLLIGLYDVVTGWQSLVKPT